MKSWQFVCDTCDTSSMHADPSSAFEAYLAHECGNRCSFCCRAVLVLVDDTGLCLSCDSVLFPSLPGGPRIRA